MIEARRDLDLAEKAFGADGRGELGAQNLDRDLALVAYVLGEINGGHAAAADPLRDRILIGEGGFDSSELVFGHELR